MKEFIVIAILFWIPIIVVIIKQNAWSLYFWQIKEYRWDRMFDHLTWDQDGHNRNAKITAIKFILFSITAMVLRLPEWTTILAVGFLYVIWVYEALDFVLKIQTKQAERPSIRSPRNILIIAGMCITLSFFLALPTLVGLDPLLQNNVAGSVLVETAPGNQLDTSTRVYSDLILFLGFGASIGAFFDLASPVFTSIFVLITSPFPWIRKKITINKAVNKYKKLQKNIQLVGITGSQGKTTLKEIVFHLLEKDFETAKTPENYNTDIGVAQSILSQIKNNTEIFVAEMGAYKGGELKSIVKHFSPTISVITDLDTQHISLFGGANELFMAKSEIIRYMKPGGVAVINGDNNRTIDLLNSTNCTIYSIFTDKKLFREATKKKNINLVAYFISGIKQKKETLEFVLTDNEGDNHEVQIPIHAKHLATSFAQAIVICSLLGMDFKKVIKKLSKLKMEMPRVSIDTGDNGSLILNDSYNISPKALISSINTLHTIWEGEFKDIEREAKLGKKILFTKGIIELGKHKESEYKKVFKETFGIVDCIVSTDSTLLKIAKEVDPHVLVVKIKNYSEFIYAYRKIVREQDLVLIAGKMPPTFMKSVVSDRM